MEITDVCRLGGVFDVQIVRGCPNPWAVSDEYKRALLHEGGTEAWIDHLVKKMGGTLIDQFSMHNKFVATGLAMVTGLLTGASATVPNRMQLGSGGTAGSPGSWTVNLTGVVTPITTNGLAEGAFTNTPSSDRTTFATTNDKVPFIKAFTASADFLTGSAPDEVAIRSATGPTCLCYAPFPAGERTLANTDVMTVTYNFIMTP